MERTLRFVLNGRDTEVAVDPSRPLLWVLRSDLGLTGTKFGCGERACGACTVLLDGRPAYSCRLPAGSAEGRTVRTIEGLSDGERLHPVQEAFVRHGALQCGFCTPGMILRAVALLEREPDPSPQRVAEAMERGLCRCGTYNRIVRAVTDAARRMRETSS